MIILDEFVSISVRSCSRQPIEMFFNPFRPWFSYDLIVAFNCFHEFSTVSI